MQRRIILTLALAALIVFGIWRPLSEQAGETGTTPAGDTMILPTRAALPMFPTEAAFVLPTVMRLPDGCNAAPPARLESGMDAHIATAAEGNGVRRNVLVRDAPAGERIDILEAGTNFRVVGSAVCSADGQRWWPIEADDLSGWSVEGFAPDDYLMVPGQR